MLRQLISKWGIMSIELQTAFENDMTFKESQDGAVSYVDVEEEPNINQDIIVSEKTDEPIPEQKELQQETVQDLL